ncbi:atypical/ABC1/ABC1-C protein kinase [Phakopsora pachyrhizi]|nr:atypical/ABC1/ABC1-C protein kinase [Phakopsora pachyrhizi]
MVAGACPKRNVESGLAHLRYRPVRRFSHSSTIQTSIINRKRGLQGLCFILTTTLISLLYRSDSNKLVTNSTDRLSSSDGTDQTLINDGLKPKRDTNLFIRIRKALKNYIIEPLATTGRFFYLLTIFLPVLVVSPILLLEFIDFGHRSKKLKNVKDGKMSTERKSTIWWYGLLVSSMQRAGPTFIKLAQWAGSRSDLFPSTLCEYFGKLHSSGKPHSIYHTRRVIEKAFGKKFEEIFVTFNPEPLGVGAVAQVYQATLRPDILPLSFLNPKHVDQKSQMTVTDITRKLSASEVEPPPIKPSSTVAIKVLHPRVGKNINRDLKIMNFLANLINRFPGAEWLSFPEEVAVFGNMMRSQIDLRLEAENLERFERNFMHRKTVGFPRPLKPYSTRNVLIEEFEDALPLKYFLKGGSGPFDRRISVIGLDAFLHMLLVDNFVHADLHPGNIMVRFYKPTTKDLLRTVMRRLTNQPDVDAGEENEQLTKEVVHSLRSLSTDKSLWNRELERLDREGYQPEVVFIDSGLVTELSELNRRNFLDLFKAIASFDGLEAGRLMVERCRSPELVIDEETFALKIHHLALKVKSQTFSLSKIKISDVLIGVLHAVRDHHVKLEADFVNTILSILILEGIGRRLNPDLDLFQSALPILRSLGSQMSMAETFRQGFRTKHIPGMIKMWLWLEARQVAGIAVAEVDSMIKYDQ